MAAANRRELPSQLVSAGADPDQASAAGKTALIQAVLSSRLGVARAFPLAEASGAA